MAPATSPYRIVPRRSSRRWPWGVVIALAWGLSLLLAWHWAGMRAAPDLAQASHRLQQAERQLAQQQLRLKALDQRQTTLARSDQISREANGDLQGMLAARDEEIAALRADAAFYQRLVGPTRQPKGLNVFSSEFVAAADRAWQYEIVLTQTLNRGAISTGNMRFLVEGVRNGKLASVDWNELHQRPAMPGQDYSFRYFQALEGRVMLPPGFTPQRIRVLLKGEDVAVEQSLDWKTGST